jgi:hypothetical protein
MEGVEIFKKPDFVERWDAAAHAKKGTREIPQERR